MNLDECTPWLRAARLSDMRDRLAYGTWDQDEGEDEEQAPSIFCAACEHKLSDRDRLKGCQQCGALVRAVDDEGDPHPSTLLNWELRNRRKETEEGLRLLCTTTPAIGAKKL